MNRNHERILEKGWGTKRARKSVHVRYAGEHEQCCSAQSEKSSAQLSKPLLMGGKVDEFHLKAVFFVVFFGEVQTRAGTRYHREQQQQQGSRTL